MMPQNLSQPPSTDQVHEVLTFETKWGMDKPSSPAMSSMSEPDVLEHTFQYTSHMTMAAGAGCWNQDERGGRGPFINVSGTRSWQK